MSVLSCDAEKSHLKKPEPDLAIGALEGWGDRWWEEGLVEAWYQW